MMGAIVNVHSVVACAYVLPTEVLDRQASFRPGPTLLYVTWSPIKASNLSKWVVSFLLSSFDVILMRSVGCLVSWWHDWKPCLFSLWRGWRSRDLQSSRRVAANSNWCCGRDCIRISSESLHFNISLTNALISSLGSFPSRRTKIQSGKVKGGRWHPNYVQQNCFKWQCRYSCKASWVIESMDKAVINLRL